METKHPLDQAAAYVGGPAKLGAILGVTAQAIGNWKERGTPLGRCLSVERATEGRITRKHLRPTDWQIIWPELIGTEGTPAVAEQGAGHV